MQLSKLDIWVRDEQGALSLAGRLNTPVQPVQLGDQRICSITVYQHAVSGVLAFLGTLASPEILRLRLHGSFSADAAVGQLLRRGFSKAGESFADHYVTLTSDSDDVTAIVYAAVALPDGPQMLQLSLPSFAPTSSRDELAPLLAIANNFLGRTP